MILTAISILAVSVLIIAAVKSDSPARGSSYYDENNTDNEIENYTRSIEINPKDATPFFNRGIAFFNKYKNLKKRYYFDLSVKNLMRSVKLNPSYPENRIKRTLFGVHSQVFQKEPVSGH